MKTIRPNDETPCHKCQYRREVIGNAHIRCANPDPKMTGNAHGIAHGWFIYPSLFDPIWKTKVCSNYSPVDEKEMK